MGTLELKQFLSKRRAGVLCVRCISVVTGRETVCQVYISCYRPGYCVSGVYQLLQAGRLLENRRVCERLAQEGGACRPA
ncbi:hypothetical protein RRG08_044299 [Elysia crispata]|uniref:Uncharacterized protein n=1 Tax=Elysia crispata TaxID=231223 RepID=A0AAE0XYB6_9GAST|nr:hypothetical protein RRG08_044299 [Elysia crispata]